MTVNPLTENVQLTKLHQHNDTTQIEEHGLYSDIINIKHYILKNDSLQKIALQYCCQVMTIITMGIMNFNLYS